MNIRLIIIFAVAIVVGGCTSNRAAWTPRPLDTELGFVAPVHASVVKNPISIDIHLVGGNWSRLNTELGIYLLIDADIPRLDRPLPADQPGLRYVEKFQRPFQISLPVGHHRLQLLAVDATRRAHIPPLISEIITINVIE